MPAVSKTLGPLHLEDLEPHRFEDLIRQLLYDFRPWRDLEATGRTGRDEGFDARAWEIVGTADLPVVDDDGEGHEETAETPAVRQWLIQCKREKAIGPARMEAYLGGLPDAVGTGLYGLIFAAACEFSIETRDRFYGRARQLGFQEAKLWGRAEIEDQLFQPRNDHLLFAYFGVSLQIRRRSVRTEIRARLAMKRKANRILQPHQSVLVRDATDERYPYLDRDKSLGRNVRGRWKVYTFDRCGAFGIEMKYRRHVAFIDDDGEHWDFAERMDDARPHDDPWRDSGIENMSPERMEDVLQWSELPQQNQGWYELNLVLPYDNVIDIDADGDEYFGGPHIYVGPFVPTGNGPFADFKLVKLSSVWDRSCPADEAKRVTVFPRQGEASTYVAKRGEDEPVVPV